RTGRRPRGARLARRLPVCAGRADLCGHQRDPAQHHRRARARSAEILTRSSIVDFTFTEDQIALRDSVSRFLMNEAAPELLREIWETAGGRSPDLRAKIAAQGVTGLSVPEAYGGLGMGDVDWALITEELGYYAIPDSLSDTAYVAAGLLCALPEECAALREQWLPKIADGSARIAIGHPVNPWVADGQIANLMFDF